MSLMEVLGRKMLLTRNLLWWMEIGGRGADLGACFKR